MSEAQLDPAQAAASAAPIAPEPQHITTTTGRGWVGGVINGVSGLSEEGGRLVDYEFSAHARHEDPGVHGDPQAAELRPAEDVFERQPGDSPVHHDLELGGRPRR